jgi:hypothetical protein
MQQQLIQTTQGNANKSIPPELLMANGVNSPTLARLIEEVKNGSHVNGNYDRCHNKHNR